MQLQTRPSLLQRIEKRTLAKGLRRKAERKTRLGFEPLETRNLLTAVTFQHGIGGYEGTQDTVIFSQDRDTNFGTEGHVSADQQDFNNVRQGLVKFESIFGDQPGQIPYGATINSATLDFFIQDDSNTAMQMSLYRMLVDWDESVATWNSFGEIGGVQASEGESSNLPPDAVLLDSETDVQRPATAGRFDVTKSLEYWAAGADNFGWLVESAATNGWDFRTKDSDLASRPKLIIDYDMPAATADFQILSTSVTEAEGNSGTRIAKIEVARLGNISAATSINYTITAGGANPADPDDFVAVATPVALQFDANDAYETIEVTINGDDELEGLETVLVTLSGGTSVAGRDVATVTIGDDDLLINEILANVSNNDDETDREYIELIGTPGADLTGYYFVVFEGEEEENGGAGSGMADFVIDLSPYTFGDNGLLVFVPGDPNDGEDVYTWEYASLAHPGTNIAELSALMGAGGVLEDNSQTYAIIRSPSVAIAQNADYDTVGSHAVYPLGTPVTQPENSIGEGVGILDQLPADAEFIDSVGVVEGGGSDRDRVLTAATLGHPGVHVHQPSPFISGGNVTSDAVSRRIGQTLPNSIGAWYNGDIANGNPANAPIRYLEDTLGFISVVAPDGAVLTPGAPNILRNVYFNLLDQEKEVAEADGIVTLVIERTGDIDNESLTVTYSTLDFGSATEDVDYTGESDTITFDPGISSIQIDIEIDDMDGLAEGFERFRVVLSNASAGYLITNGSPTSSGNPNGEATVTIVDANVSLATFQNGVNGYTGTSDAYIDGEFVTDLFGQDPVIRVDLAKGAEPRPQQGLLRFDDMFGDALNQVPMGSKIFDAFLTLNVSNTASGGDIRFFRMLQDWEQVGASWQSPQGNAGGVITDGVTPDGFEATAKADAIVAEPGRAGFVEIPLNVETIQSWANGSIANFGWSIISTSPSLWSFNSSEVDTIGSFKPELTILYTSPEESEVGTFSLTTDSYTVNENGGSATIRINRVGGDDLTSPVTVNWAVTPGTGTLADITGTGMGSVTFTGSELFETFTVPIFNDSSIERNETLNLTISGTGLTFDRSTATLTIRDNDFIPTSGNLLLSEIFMNSPGNDPPHEFIELSGLANMGLGSLYYVAVEGLVGPNVGAFDKVVDLGAYFNGSNGLSLLTPQEPGYAYYVNPATTHIQDLGTVAVENVNTNNDSVTIMILYSPTRELSTFAFDYDWNDDGSLDLPLGVQVVDSLGVRTLGQDDQTYGPLSNILSFEATEVDAISRNRSDSDRNDGTAWFGGNLTSAGDDYLLYESTSIALPVTGASMSPGDTNTGTDVQSPLVSLTSVTPNANGTVTVTFNGPVSQVLSGDGSPAVGTGSGISITATNGEPITVIDAQPLVTGIGTNTLTLAFTGSGVIGGQLPEGVYQLNFVGNGIVANGRAVDVSNDDTQIDAFHEFQFAVGAPTLVGDYNDDGHVDAADYTVWRNNLGGLHESLANRDPANGTGVVSTGDYTSWKANYGNTLPPGAGGLAAAGAGGGGGLTLVATTSLKSVAEPSVEEEASVSSAVAFDAAIVDVPARRFALNRFARGIQTLRNGTGPKAADDLLAHFAGRRGMGSESREDGEGGVRNCRAHDADDVFDGWDDSRFAEIGELLLA